MVIPGNIKSELLILKYCVDDKMKVDIRDFFSDGNT